MKKTTKSAKKNDAQKEDIVLNKSIEEFEMEVQTRFVTFRYKKKNGKMRIANGTTSLALIPPAFWPKGNRVQPVQECRTVSTFSYWDREEYDWRCFHFDLFEGFEEVEIANPAIADVDN